MILDRATALGFVGAWCMVALGILFGTRLLVFVDLPSLAIVGGATVAVVFVGHPLGSIVSAARAFRLAFRGDEPDARASIQRLAQLASRARREGLLSLEDAADPQREAFLSLGLRMMSDGQSPSSITAALDEAVQAVDRRHQQVHAVYDTVADVAPAMGLVGTLIGLVQMLQGMDDPSRIGPAMATALLTTFYGALLANLFAGPIAARLRRRSDDQLAHMRLQANGMLAIVEGEPPRFMTERLEASLAPLRRPRAA